MSVEICDIFVGHEVSLDNFATNTIWWRLPYWWRHGAGITSMIPWESGDSGRTIGQRARFAAAAPGWMIQQIQAQIAVMEQANQLPGIPMPVLDLERDLPTTPME